MAVTIQKSTSENENKGAMIAAESEAMEMLARICPNHIHPILIADRGFGHPRWMWEIQKRGWHFVQYLSPIHQVTVEQHMGTLKELGLRRASRVRDWDGEGWPTCDTLKEYVSGRFCGIRENEE